MTEWYFSPVGSYTTVGGVMLLLLLAATVWRLARDRLSFRQRAILLGLRLAVLLLLLVALLRPSLVEVQTKRQASTLIVILDRSRSMQVADGFGGKTRWQSLSAAVDDALPALRSLAPDIEVKLYAFDAVLSPLNFGAGQLDLGKPEGLQTAIGAAMDDAARREAGKRLAGMVLLSDGAQRAYSPRDIAPQSPARRLADLGTPLYTFPFGQPRGGRQTRDVAIKDLLVNQSVYVKNRLAVGGTVELSGFANEQLTVQLLFEDPGGKMQVVNSQPLRSTKESETLPISLTHVPDSPGERKLVVSIAEQNGETVTTNNQQGAFVTVVEGGLNVLYVEGALRPEQKFLVWSLDSSDDIGLTTESLVERDPAKRSLDLVPRLVRGKCDVVILGDVDASMLKPTELAAIDKLVREGAGLAMLGGFHAFGPGGYSKTPLAQLAPVQMQDIERQGFDESIRSDMHIKGPLRMRPAKPLGLTHYLMALTDDGDNAAVWARLPTLDGANKLVPKPAARVLAESAEGDPLLIVQDAGGRVMAMAVDSTWRWWMRGFEREHKRFWRQAVLWLAHKEDQTRDAVWIKLAQRRFSPGSRVEFAVGARNSDGEPVTDAAIKVEVVAPDGSRHAVQPIRQADQFSAFFSDSQVDGDYTIEASAELAGKSLGSAKARFLVYKQDLEMDNAAADPTLLESLAKMTERAGGKSYAPEELSALIKQIRKQPPDTEVSTRVKHTPWDKWPFFLLFVGLLCTEWGLRKKWGLV